MQTGGAAGVHAMIDIKLARRHTVFAVNLKNTNIFTVCPSFPFFLFIYFLFINKGVNEGEELIF